MDNKDIRLLKQIEDSAVSMPELTEKSEYSKQQVHYRLNEKWTEYVRKESETENPGAARSTTLWNLSKAGKEKLESVEITDEDENTIETFDDLAEAAEEARQDASSAKSSVQTYRKKVSRMDQRLSSIKEAIGEPWSEMNDVELLTSRDKDGLRADYDILESKFESLEESLEIVKTDVEDKSEEIEDLQDTLQSLQEKSKKMRTKQTELKSENRKLKTEINTQSSRISELENRIEELETDESTKSIIEQLADLF
jgi:chromosome segregation ATPase